MHADDRRRTLAAMGEKRGDRIRRGDKRFLFRLGLAALAALLASRLLFGAIERADFGDWATRGFLLLTGPAKGD